MKVYGWILALACTLAFAACDAPNAPSATTTPVPVATVTSASATRTPTPTTRALRRATPVATPSVKNDLNVTLVRSGGLIGRPQIYVLTSDGTVDMSFANLQVDGGAAAAQQLAQNIAATGIFDVPPGNYASASVCCDRYTYELRISQDGRAYVYETIDDSPDTPPALAQTIVLIEHYIAAAR